MSSSDQEEVAFRWNAVCIDGAPADYDSEVGFYRDLVGTEVAEREERWAAVQEPQSGMWLNIQAADGCVPPVGPKAHPRRRG
jgi:hypothetical protein